VEAVCRDTHRQVYQEVLPTSQEYAERQVYQVEQVPTEATCQERNHEVDQMVTEADFQRLLPSQCHLPMTTGCKIYSPEHAEALNSAQTALACFNLVCITIFREAHLLDINEWDETTWLTYTINDSRRLQPMPAVEAPIYAKSWAEALPPWQFRQRPRPRWYELTVQYWMAGRMQYEFRSRDKEELRSKARVCRKWFNRVSELWTGGKLSMGIPFFCFFSSLLFSILNYFLGLGPV